MTSPWRDAIIELAEVCNDADGVPPFDEATLLALEGDSSRIYLGLVDSGHAPANYGSAGIDSQVRIERISPVHLNTRHDRLIGCAQINTATGSVELVIAPQNRRCGYGTRLLRACLDHAPRAAFWAHGNLAGSRGLARAHNLSIVRRLLRLGMVLDYPDASVSVPDLMGVRIRPFISDDDDQLLLSINARAFAEHPEQGLWTSSDLDARRLQPWFDPQDILLAELDEQLVGFIWLKHENNQGEIYVLGVDPDFQGRGFGQVLLEVGVERLRGLGCTWLTLFVEGDNAKAVGLYTKMGFAVERTDVQYARR